MAVTEPRMMETFSNSINAGVFIEKFIEPILGHFRLKDGDAIAGSIF